MCRQRRRIKIICEANTSILHFAFGILHFVHPHDKLEFERIVIGWGDFGNSACIRCVYFSILLYPLPYCTHWDTRLRVAEEISATSMTWL